MLNPRQPFVQRMPPITIVSNNVITNFVIAALNVLLGDNNAATKIYKTKYPAKLTSSGRGKKHMMINDNNTALPDIKNSRFATAQDLN